MGFPAAGIGISGVDVYKRQGIYIIDLQKTVKKLDDAYMFVRELSANGERCV